MTISSGTIFGIVLHAPKRQEDAVMAAYGSPEEAA
jgi:hypothetical protein